MEMVFEFSLVHADWYSLIEILNKPNNINSLKKKLNLGFRV